MEINLRSLFSFTNKVIASVISSIFHLFAAAIYPNRLYTLVGDFLSKLCFSEPQ